MNESEEKKWLKNDNDDPQSFLSQGNKHFIYKRFSSAISDYTQGLKYFMVQEFAAAEVEADPSEDHCDSQACVENGPRTTESASSTKQCLKKEKKNKFVYSFCSSSKNSTSSVFLDLLSNRALAYLSIQNYSAALQDTRNLLEGSPGHVKGVIRHAKALGGLRQYQNAINFLTNATKGIGKGDKLEHSRELLSLIERLKRMKHQSETGDYFDVSQIIEKHYEPAPEDWVDYTGAVKVVSVEGKGRGLVAVQDLPAGKLILACRAFEIIFLGKEGNPGEGISEESGEALKEGSFKVEDDATLNLLARKIYDRLVRNKEKRQEFYQLHAGNDLCHLDPLPVTGGDAGVQYHPLDMARIYGICKTNTFANAGDSYPEVEKSVGLWIFPAYVNHQCIGGNCTWKIFSDFIFFRTYRAVKKGEELVVSYVSPAFSFRARTEVLTKRLGFVCPCILCELDRALPQSFQEDKERLKILANNQEVKFAQLDPNQGSREEYRKKVETSILLLEQIIGKLEKIQPKHGIYNASLLDPLQKLGLKYFGIGEFNKMTKVMERACGLMKSCMLPHGVADCSLWIIAAYMQMGNLKQAKKWGKVLKEYLMLAYGDLKVLKVLGSWVIEPMTQWGLLK